jgi:hypothetical protein
MDSSTQQYSVEILDDYVHLRTWGPLDVNNLDAPANAALTLAKERNIEKLLDDIREVDSTNVSIPIQAKAMGILWKLRTFKKVAVVMSNSRLRDIFFSTLDAINLERDVKFKGFDDTPEAVKWLEED